MPVTSLRKFAGALLLLVSLAAFGTACDTVGTGDGGEDTGGDKEAMVESSAQRHVA